MQFVLLATALALAISLLGTPVLIDLFRARGVGQLVREDGPTTHYVKHGTPTMGGLIVLIGATIAYAAAHVRPFDAAHRFSAVSPAAVLVLASAWSLGVLGALDDLSKIRKRRSLGLNKRAKLIGQALIGFGLAYGATNWVGIHPSISYAGGPAELIKLPQILFAVWILFVIAGTSNAVNLTDGLDGLACGSTAMALFVFVIISFWEFRNPSVYAGIDNRGLLDLAIVAAALLGACIGFLWWNAAPARIFMGDTGSLALGGALASLALFTRTQVLLSVIGGLFVLETVSVIIQVISYRAFDHRRVFLMAPLHHHFELKGWAEFTVIVRFWLIAALLAGLGLALFYMDFLKVSVKP